MSGDGPSPHVPQLRWPPPTLRSTLRFLPAPLLTHEAAALQEHPHSCRPEASAPPLTEVSGELKVEAGSCACCLGDCRSSVLAAGAVKRLPRRRSNSGLALCQVTIKVREMVAQR